MWRNTLILFALFIILLIFGMIFARLPLYANDGMVGMLERHFQVVPGATRVLPECGCTVRYLGTTVHGRRYTVTIERLD